MYTFIFRLDIKNKVISIESSQTVEVKEGNTVAPYVFKRVRSAMILTNTYSFTFQELFVLDPLFHIAVIENAF